MSKEETQRELLTLLGDLLGELSIVRKDLWSKYAYDFFEKFVEKECNNSD
jgi:hypothetical protein